MILVRKLHLTYEQIQNNMCYNVKTFKSNNNNNNHNQPKEKAYKAHQKNVKTQPKQQKCNTCKKIHPGICRYKTEKINSAKDKNQDAKGSIQIKNR